MTTAMYKKRIPYFKAKSIPIEEVSYEIIAVDCSCEIWMMLFHMQFQPVFVEFFDVYFRLNPSIIEAERFVIKYLISEINKIKQKIEKISKCQLVFEARGGSPHKERVLKKRLRARNEAYKDFLIALKFSQREVSKRYLEYIHTDANHFQQQVAKHFSSTVTLHDSDLLLSTFKTVYSHDMDVILFGCSMLITKIDDNDVYYKSLGDMLRQWRIADRPTLVAICILLGTDYNEGREGLTFGQCRKMNNITELIADQKELYELFLRQAETL